MFVTAKTKTAVLEIMKDPLVSESLRDSTESRYANERAWKQFAGIIMRFNARLDREFAPPGGLTPRQRAIWFVQAWLELGGRAMPKDLSPTVSVRVVCIAIETALNSYADEHHERTVLHRAQVDIANKLKAWC